MLGMKRPVHAAAFGTNRHNKRYLEYLIIYNRILCGLNALFEM